MQRFVGAFDFEAVGNTFLGHCVDLGSLTPSDRVLDVGCGIGRLALPLSRYLSAQGSYLGVDTWPEGIRWCERHVATRFPHSAFRLLDVYDDQYNPSARAGDDAITIDAPPASFDFATLISILHLDPPRVRRYLGEIGRLLRPGGHCLCTWYLLDEDDDRPTTQLPRAAVSEPAARAMLTAAGIEVIAVHRGQWDGRADGLSYQDIVVGRRPEHGRSGTTRRPRGAG